MVAPSRICTACRTPVPTDAAFCISCGAPTPTSLIDDVPTDMLGDDFQQRLATALAGRYQLVRELGRGGMAIVYLADDVRHERQVAIKILRPELAEAIGGDRFVREIKLAAKLTHQNILALYDSGEADGFLYYVMPFVEGESLRHRLQRERQLTIEDALRITKEVAEGLDYAHELGVIHRDIKPENILLQRGHALIADFGIAKAVSSAGGTSLTSTGTSIGTPLYMSPEQAAGEPNLDGRTDVYSLGCVLYEMLVGEPPFTGSSRQAIMAKHALEARPSVRVVRDTVPEAVDQAIQRAMAKVPADRLRTAGRLAQDAGGARAGETHGRQLATTAGQRAPGRRTLGAPIAVVALVLAVVMTISLRGFLRSPGPGPSGQAPDAGRVASIRLSPEIVRLFVGSQQTVFASAFDEAGRSVKAAFEWTSADPQVAGVLVHADETDFARLEGNRAGVTSVQVRSGGTWRVLRAEVFDTSRPGTSPGPTRAQLVPASLTLVPGERDTVFATYYDGGLPSVAAFEWINSNPQIVRLVVDLDQYSGNAYRAIVEALRPGEAHVQAHWDRYAATTRIRVVTAR